MILVQRFKERRPLLAVVLRSKHHSLLPDECLVQAGGGYDGHHKTSKGCLIFAGIALG